jgi:putative PIN family toxin of toxin-antitoxin system
VISATLDTSVYIRALHFGGPATVIIGHARAGNIRIDISDAIVAETNRVLRDEFQWDGYSLQDARGKLLALGNYVSPTETLHIIKEDPDDDRILECAATAKSDFIVSEDKDLLRASSIRRCSDRVDPGLHQFGAHATGNRVATCRGSGGSQWGKAANQRVRTSSTVYLSN